MSSPNTPQTSTPASSEAPRVTPPGEEYTPNFQWMKDHIGDVLVQGITETLLLRPEDPIEYLGQWLAQNSRNLLLEEQLIREKAVIQAELDEKKRISDEKSRQMQASLDKEQRKKQAVLREQEEAKARVEAGVRARELELIRAERTENRPPPAFGIPETILEVPSMNTLTAGQS